MCADNKTKNSRNGPSPQVDHTSIQNMDNNSNENFQSQKNQCDEIMQQAIIHHPEFHL